MNEQQLSEWAEAVAVTTLMRLKENRVKMRPEVEREIHYQLSLDVRLHLELVSQAADELRDERRKLADILGVEDGADILTQVETLRDFADQFSGSVGEQDELAKVKAQRDALLDLLEYVYEDVSQGAIPNHNDEWYAKTDAAIATAKGTNE
jgi:alcohol dehydrogenase class IV